MYSSPSDGPPGGLAPPPPGGYIRSESYKPVGKGERVMSEHTNAEVIRQAYEAFGRGDIPEVLDLLTDDVDWALQGPSVIPWAGPGRGREAVAEFFSLL